MLFAGGFLYTRRSYSASHTTFSVTWSGKLLREGEPGHSVLKHGKGHGLDAIRLSLTSP